MDELEKVEKLRQRANVSYEEARDALQLCDGDLLDAMVYLERMGQAKAPEQATFSTSAKDKASYENVPEVVERHQETDDPSFGEQLGRALKIGFRKSMDNSLVVTHRNREVFRIPILLFIVILLFGHIPVLIIMGISLFCDVRYSFEGKDDLSSINNVMDKAGSKASQWVEEAKSEERNTEKARAAEEKSRRKTEKAERKAEERAARFEKKADERAARFEQKVDEKAARFEQKVDEKAARFEQKADDFGRRISEKFEKKETKDSDTNNEHQAKEKE